jgi:lipopolysaccharide transport system ATP-binding protein
MNDVAISVEGLGKNYRIPPAQTLKSYRTLQEELLALPRRLWASARRTTPDRDRFWALQNVSFEVKQGQVLGIIGRNGAGKSTLLKILARITDPSLGQAKVYGQVGSLLEVGTGFHAELTGRENIYLNGAILGMRRHEIQRRFDQIVDFAEVHKFIDTPVKHFSSGMYMRLAFAVAAHLEAEILLIDEVLAVGDAEFQKKCLGKMEEVAQGGRTVVFVSHNLNAIEQLCNVALLLESGELRLMDSDVGAVLKRYLFGSQGQPSVAEWLNHRVQYHNPWFTPRRFFISDKAGVCQGMPVSNADEFYVQIEAEIAEIDPALTVGYAIYAEDGTLLFYSYQTDMPEAHWPRLKPGRCVLRSQVPTGILNEGTYRVELIGALHFRKWLFQPAVDAPYVHLTIQGRLSESPHWLAKRPGVLAPVLSWSLLN